MKKKLIYPLLVCTMLSCSACSQTEKNDKDKNEVTVKEIPTNDAPKAADIQIELSTNTKAVTHADGTTLYTKSYTYPIVTITTNPDAAAKINASIQEEIDAFNAEPVSPDYGHFADYAKENYAVYLESGSNDSFIPYRESLTYKINRSDSNVISFVITYYADIGGAHGNSESHTVNYHTDSGEVIAFSDLSDNPEQFRADTLAYNQKLAASEGYVERLYSPEMATIEELEPVLYSEYSWYLSTSGLVFISDPYALGPYAAGTIEFIIPYADLAQMGFKEDYAYTGNLMIKVQDGSSYTLDINGDGKEDTIQFYSEQLYKKGNVTHLVINDTDLLQESNPELVETFRDEYAGWGYALYDLDATDETIELVFYSSESNFMYSNFYRYDIDATLTYLGKVRGSVDNPCIDTDNLIP